MKKLILPVALLGFLSFVAAKQPQHSPNHSSRSQHSGDAESSNGHKGLRAETDLSGDQEVPPNDSDAEGEFKMKFNCAFTEARYSLEVEADDVLQAHLHCGSAGENGPVVVFLFGLFPGGIDVDGELASFTLRQQNLDAVNADCMAAVGYQIETLEDLAEAIAAGDIYANVHTVAFPPGEIRGQVELDGRPDRCGNGNHDDDDDDDDGGDNENENENDNDNENDNGNGNGHDHGG